MDGIQTSILDTSTSAITLAVHISERLDEVQRRKLVASLEKNDGIIYAMFCHLQYHLMLVSYDRDRYSSKYVLKALRAEQVKARLIGAV